MLFKSMWCTTYFQCLILNVFVLVMVGKRREDWCAMATFRLLQHIRDLPGYQLSFVAEAKTNRVSDSFWPRIVSEFADHEPNIHGNW